jgi:hypothetical protein
MIIRCLKLAVLLTGVLAGGCAGGSWVKPYERERLADPIMKTSRDQISDWQLQHVHQTREAARGAGAVVTGGCGCN